jgi:hypothetical protein
MTKIALSFGSPEHGWLAVHLERDGVARELDVSDVPGDSLHMLATAVLHLLEGRATETTVTWFLEPEEETWTFQRAADVFRLEVRESGRGKERVLFAEGTVNEICAPVWRALRRLEVDDAWSSQTAWSYPFPAAEVAALAAQIRADGGGRSEC